MNDQISPERFQEIIMQLESYSEILVHFNPMTEQENKRYRFRRLK